MAKPVDVTPDSEMLFRASSDMSKRSTTGCFIYLLIWFAIVLPNKFYETAPSIALCFTALFVFFSVSRIALIVNFDRLYQKSVLLWKSLFYPSVFLPALTWGVLCAIALIHPAFKPISLIIIISTAGLSAGGVAALVPNRLLTIGLLSGFLLPGIVTLITSKDYNISLSLVFCIYWIGMYSTTKIQHREYWLGLKASFLLQKHAKELQQKNTLDGLTGLKNRSFLDDFLRKEFKKAVRSGGQLSLLLIDIDHFKNINDQYGHLVGDECLRQLANKLKLMIKRETDVVARYGGEEFAIILPGMGREETLTMAHKVRKEIEGLTISYNNLILSITVSIGVSCSNPSFGQTEFSIIEKADKALYIAKNNNRNQVVI